MKRFAQALTAAAAVLMLSCESSGQQAEAPVYKDGDWWRVKVEGKHPTGVTVAGPQLGGFPEYLVKIEAGVVKVFGINEDRRKEMEAPYIISLVLGKPDWRGELLRFPMKAGLTWSSQFQVQLPGLRGRWEEGRYEVQAWEKVKTPKGELDAFKIVMNVPGRQGPKGILVAARKNTYYYSPRARAIVYLQEESGQALTTSTLVDFNVVE